MLTDALVSGHLRLYRNSAEFHQGVDLLARSLVRFVDIMAEDAERAEAHRRTLIEAMERTSPEEYRLQICGMCGARRYEHVEMGGFQPHPFIPEEKSNAQDQG